MSGDDVEGGRIIPVRDRDSRIGGDSHGRRDPRHDFKGNAFLKQDLQLFPASPEDERISAFQTEHALPFLCLPHKDDRDMIVEDGIAIRAVKRLYGEFSGDIDHKFEPKDIFDIAEGRIQGDAEAAKKAFAGIGAAAGDAMATAASLIDGLIVIGGGVTASHKYFMPALLAALRGKIHSLNGEETGRVQSRIYNLDDSEEFAAFARGDQRKLKVYGFDDEVIYDPQKRIGIAISKLGASRAISVGAYTFALSQLDKMQM